MTKGGSTVRLSVSTEPVLSIAEGLDEVSTKPEPVLSAAEGSKGSV